MQLETWRDSSISGREWEKLAALKRQVLVLATNEAAVDIQDAYTKSNACEAPAFAFTQDERQAIESSLRQLANSEQSLVLVHVTKRSPVRSWLRSRVNSENAVTFLVFPAACLTALTPPPPFN